MTQIILQIPVSLNFASCEFWLFKNTWKSIPETMILPWLKRTFELIESHLEKGTTLLRSCSSLLALAQNVGFVRSFIFYYLYFGVQCRHYPRLVNFIETNSIYTCNYLIGRTKLSSIHNTKTKFYRIFWWEWSRLRYWIPLCNNHLLPHICVQRDFLQWSILTYFYSNYFSEVFT